MQPSDREQSSSSRGLRAGEGERSNSGFSLPKAAFKAATSRKGSSTSDVVGQSGQNVSGLKYGSESSKRSLATHYIPDKLVSAPTSWGAEARRQSRIAAGGLGAAAGRSRPRDSSSVRSSNTGDVAATSAVDPAPGTAGAQPPRARKWGAGRRAWGANGGGHAALGAGGYESDDGVELDQSRDSYSMAEERKFEAKPTRMFANLTIPSSERDPTLSPGATSNTNSNSDETHSHSPLGSDGTKRRRSLFARLFGVSLPTRDNRGKWNQFKWIMFAANFVLTAYTIAGLIAILLTWANYFPKSNALLVVNHTEMVLGTIAMCLCLITAIIGWTGILLNNRAFLAVYATMLWVALAFIVAPGYIAYKRRTFNLSGKMNHLWSRELDLTGRRMVQTVLQCCGYYSPYIEAAADGNRCYARSNMPGCKGPLVDFERQALLNIYAVAFALVPAHLACIVLTMLCANHITYRFGKGVTPARYRIDDQTIRLAYQNSAMPRGMQSTHQHVLYADQSPLDEPRPHFWHESSSLSNKAKS